MSTDRLAAVKECLRSKLETYMPYKLVEGNYTFIDISIQGDMKAFGPVKN